MCDCNDDEQLLVAGMPEFITDESGRVYSQHLSYTSQIEGRRLPVPFHTLRFSSMDTDFYFQAESQTVEGCVEKWKVFFSENPKVTKGNAYRELSRFLETTSQTLMTMPVQDLEKVKQKLNREFSEIRNFGGKSDDDYRYALQFLQLHICATINLLNGPHSHFSTFDQ